MSRTFLPLFLLGAGLVVLPLTHMRAAEEPEFTQEYLNDPENIELGHELWQQQCTKCHGRSSYPGKAPKLRPGRMTPREIYLKMTYGFGKMPAWEEVFSEEERKAITAYVKSDIFSP